MRKDAGRSRGVKAEKTRDLLAPAVVIVHGAWFDGTGWREVIALLQEKGLDVIAVQNPLSSLTEDADAVTRAIDHQARSVVLVGHGYGGTVITQAGSHAKVAALVYVAAFAPDQGESTTDAQKGAPPPPCVARLEIDAGGFIYLAHGAVAEFLAQDLPAVDGRILAAAQQPIRASTLADRVTSAAWRAKPSWYLVTEQDRMLPPGLQREIARKIRANVVAVPASHVPFLSKPQETSAVILAAVDFVRGAQQTRGLVAAVHDHG